MYYRDHDKGADLRPRSKSQKHLSHYWGEFLPAEGEGLEQTERGLIIRGASLGTALANEQMGGGGGAEKIQEVWGRGAGKEVL